SVLMATHMDTCPSRRLRPIDLEHIEHRLDLLFDRPYGGWLVGTIGETERPIVEPILLRDVAIPKPEAEEVSELRNQGEHPPGERFSVGRAHGSPETHRIRREDDGFALGERHPIAERDEL